MRRHGRLLSSTTTLMVVALTLGAAVVASAGASPPATTSAAPAKPTVAVAIPANHPLSRDINQNLIGFDHFVSGPAASLIQTLHPQWARMDADLGGAYDCTTGAWTPSVLDPTVQTAEATGAKPVVIVDYAPTCLTTKVPAGDNPAYSPPDLGANLAKWQSLVEQMAEYEITNENVTNFEVWNEANGRFWNGTAKQYYQLYGATAKALEDAASVVHRTIEVGGPALADFVATPDMFWLRGFLSYVAQHHLPLNFLSWHQYFNSPDQGEQPSWPDGLCVVGKQQADGQCDNPQLNPAGVATWARTFRQLLREYGLHAQLWLDEWNINSGFDPRMSYTYDAAFVAAVLDSAQSAGLTRSNFYEAEDDSTADNFGVLNGTGTPKPDYYSFELWHELTGRQLPATVTPSAATSVHPFQPDIGAVSSKDAGVIHVELYNFVPAGPDGRPSQIMPTDLTRRISVVLKGLGGSGYQVIRTVINTRHSGTVISGDERVASGGRLQLTADLDAQSVELLTLRPAATS